MTLIDMYKWMVCAVNSVLVVQQHSGKWVNFNKQPDEARYI